MTHLFLSREFPPAAYPPGGIGTYVRYISELLAASGEVVHVIAHRWPGAPLERETRCDGRLIVHRVALDDPSTDAWSMMHAGRRGIVPRSLLRSSFPSAAFSWQAALAAERLVETEGIDVIEAQEWEAPLYFFQLRRASQMGPAARPPCVVHLHSSTEQIFQANQWDTSVSDFASAAAMEEYSIEAADALLCPSQFIADLTTRRYKVSPSTITVIPYPLGDVPHIDRDPATWASGTICHVGRLERRKGVIELADAFREIGLATTPCSVEFIGGDVPLESTGGPLAGDAVRERLPAGGPLRVKFTGSLARPDLFVRLSKAFAAVVPSQWDNLPYTSIEAMCTGLPLVVSPNGGMKEIVEDGVSGWIAPDATAAGIATALRRALDSPAAERERMGRAAEESVRRICGNDVVVRRQLALRKRLVAQGSRTLRVPEQGRGGVGIVIRGPASHDELAGWQSAARHQTLQPEVMRAAQVPTSEVSTALQMAAGSSLAAVAIVDTGLVLEPDCLQKCAAFLGNIEDAGAVTGWTHEPGRRLLSVPILPSEVTGILVIRADALTRLGATEGTPLDAKNLVRRLQQNGWKFLTYPGVLDERPGAGTAAGSRSRRYSAMARAVQRMHEPVLEWFFTCPAEERQAVIRAALRTPMRSFRLLASRLLRSGQSVLAQVISV